MFIRPRALTLGLLLASLWAAAPLTAQPPSGSNEQHQNRIKAAARKVAPSVVQITTQGGTDRVVIDAKKGVTFSKAIGPTTGVIVSADGYIISSAFNFINNPKTIQVIIPGEEPLVAERIATDRSRMLTLLKVKKTGLPVPAVVPKKDIKVGQWAIALGRTLDAKLKKDSPPSISIGIISALNRIWGKAVQTDAKVSPVNYGGPLVDIRGRVQGILVPASPRTEGETAGFEWYDSGIGFAVPMEDVLAMLPRLKEGKDMHKGELGVALKNQGDEIGAVPVVAAVQAGSAAVRGGVKTGDTILEVDGKAVINLAQIRHAIGTKYEGDSVTLKVKRGNDTLPLTFDLVSDKTVYQHPYLGILPVRDDPELGVLVRYVYPKSPADKMGLKAGDQITKVTIAGKALAFTGEKRGQAQMLDWLNAAMPGQEIKLDVIRKAAKQKAVLTGQLDGMPGSTLTSVYVVPKEVPEPTTLMKAQAPLKTSGPNIKPQKQEPLPKDPKTGFLKRTNAAGNHPYWVYVPPKYDPNISYALVVWLHQPGKYTDEENEKVKDMWEDFCNDNHCIVLGPKSEADAGWVPSEQEIVTAAVRDVLATYNIDRQRIVAHGMGVGGQMAISLGFGARDLFRGVATTGAVPPLEPGNNVANQRLSFFIACGGRDPIVRALRDRLKVLIERRFPTWYLELPDRGREYFDEATLSKLAMWIETLDRM